MRGCDVTRFLIVEDHPLFREALESAVRLANPEATILQATSIHEAIDVDVLRRVVPDKSRIDAIVARHTTPEQAAGIFNRVSPRLAVFSHSPGTAAIVEQTRRSYPGRVEMGEDLMIIDIGAEVRVKPGVAEVLPR